MIKNLKIDTKIIPIEAGWYILIYNPRETNSNLIQEALMSIDDNAPDCNFIMIPSYNPDSIRLLKTEIPVKIEKEDD